jgi:hypothetical protein
MRYDMVWYGMVWYEELMREFHDVVPNFMPPLPDVLLVCPCRGLLRQCVKYIDILLSKLLVWFGMLGLLFFCLGGGSGVVVDG